MSMKRCIQTSALFILLVSGCTQKNEVVVDPGTPSFGEFSVEIKPILYRNCGGQSCHGGGPQGFAGGLDLTSFEGIFRGSRYGTVVVSGNPFMSHLLQTINRTDTMLSPISGMMMPASRNPLPRRDVQAIARWIADGARDDNGNLPFPEPRPFGKVFFTSQSVDLVGVLDLETGLIMRYVTAGNPLPFTQPPQAPHNVQIDDQGAYYYVTLITGNKLKKYNAATHELVGEAAVGTFPAHVVVTHDGSKAYVTNFDPNFGRVYSLNTATMTVSAVISAGSFMGRTHGARLSQDGEYLYVGSNGTDLVHIISTSNDSVVAHVSVGGGVPLPQSVYRPYQIAVRNDDRFIYVTCNGRGLVSVIERMPDDSFHWRDTIAVGERPLQCEVTRDGRYLYVCNQGSGSVSVIDAQTNQPLTTIPDVGKQPHGIDITDDSRTVYVTCENVLSGDPPHHPVTGSKAPGYIALIDVGTNQVFRRIEVGGFAAGVSIYPGRGN